MTKTADKAQLSFYFPIEQKIKTQERANKLSIILADLKNIEETLPALLPHQHQNVVKAEKRFFSPKSDHEDGLNKGILFTDNTGSGKTYSGGGIINRFHRMGKKNVLIVVPTDVMCQKWISDMKNLGVYLYQLDGIKDAGKPGMSVVTTYANMRQNKALEMRARRTPFDLIMLDESHNLIMNYLGQETDATEAFKQLANPWSVAMDKARIKYEAQMDKDFAKKPQLSEETEALLHAEATRLEEATKVVFLSATPFSYHKNLIYADGILFNIKESAESPIESYNAFFCDNFQYQVKFNVLTKPDEIVDVGKLEREFHTRMVSIGCISSTRMTLDKDYSREFVLMEDALGSAIDEGYKIATDEERYKILPEICRKRFSYMYTAQLLEAIKAKLSIERIRQHIALGRKVIVFHHFNHALPVHPFHFNDEKLFPEKIRTRQISNEIDDFYTRFPKFRQLDLTGLGNPIKTFTEAFGEGVVTFNGTMPKKKRNEMVAAFNRDDSGVDIFLGQDDASKEGISLHDTTGAKMRVSMSLSLPIKPVIATQTEGRSYRIGQKTDAAFEYAVLHTNYEKIAFSTINDRVATVENFAFGEAGRNLREAFKEGYKNPVMEPPHAGQGKGSKDLDMLFEDIDHYARAITIYQNRLKRMEKMKHRDGTDVPYDATPEPLGLKMVEWLQPAGGHRLLEPSAGHGAIARYFPENCQNKMIEPVYSLRADLSINSTGHILSHAFEKLHIINKFDGIAMNPPRGVDGRTAIAHLYRSTNHLDNGGRVVSVVPDTEYVNTKMKSWQINRDEWMKKGLHLVASVKLPACVFEHGERMQLIIIDKQMQGDVQGLDPMVIEADTVEQFFELIKGLSMPARRTAGLRLLKRPEHAYCTVVETKHTRHGHDLWVVKMLRPTTEKQFDKAKSRALESGGRFSSYEDEGAIPGFQFKGRSGKSNAWAASDAINKILATMAAHS